MVFDIGAGYKFSPDNGCIYSNGEEVYTIKGIRKKILEFLLENQGNYVPRKEIIFNAWGKDDVSIFNASLTQQIYLLRKDFSMLGLDRVIFSNPKQGYKIISLNLPFDITSDNYPESRRNQHWIKTIKDKISSICLMFIVIILGNLIFLACVYSILVGNI
ncbi:winged helix-turn-helix domain-containing protein [Klebsiella aerogenes]|uniref:winged helix-turn-helix domain-containing protein n=1 Tax=Klebsiella aerogenes TaxID=548 RepID=UPI001908A9FB|nr:winged helix-turn-helix domain-containing protein [Klebsiella aerogenes]MBK0469639.1 hypothetical protein [Klebsiella aerogenes]